MKPLILLFLVALIALPAQAAPALVVDATLTIRRADNSEDIWHPLPLTLPSGNKGVLKSADHQLEVTPTLKDGTVVVAMSLTRLQGGKEIVEARPQIAMRPGQMGSIEVGDFKFSITVTLAP